VTDNNGWLLDMSQNQDKSSWVVGTRGSNVNNGASSCLWLDVIYRYLGQNIGVLECPAQTARRALPAAPNFKLLPAPAPFPHDPSSPTSGTLVQPQREYWPGYMVTSQIHTWTDTFSYPYSLPPPYSPLRYLGLKHNRFRNPASKIWYADSGREWDTVLQIAIEDWTPIASRGQEDVAGGQISWRHGSVSNPRGNVVFFDGHAATIDPREVTSQKAYYLFGALPAADREKLIRYWDADGDGNYTTPNR
jgi:prepilin-type processing-associated H-X9-DG protein